MGKKKKEMGKLWFMLLLLSWQAAASISNNAKPVCQEKCGDVSVRYPFGIDNHKCGMNKYFFLNCNTRISPPKLWFRINSEVFNNRLKMAQL